MIKAIQSLTLMFLLQGSYSAQELNTMSPEDYKKISRHIQNNYNVPPEMYDDSLDGIRYLVGFTIDENGHILDPEISSKTADCEACEKELLRVMNTIPGMTRGLQNANRQKTRYTIPFYISIQ